MAGLLSSGSSPHRASRWRVPSVGTCSVRLCASSDTMPTARDAKSLADPLSHADYGGFGLRLQKPDAGAMNMKAHPGIRLDASPIHQPLEIDMPNNPDRRDPQDSPDSKEPGQHLPGAQPHDPAQVPPGSKPKPDLQPGGKQGDRSQGDSKQR